MIKEMDFINTGISPFLLPSSLFPLPSSLFPLPSSLFPLPSSASSLPTFSFRSLNGLPIATSGVHIETDVRVTGGHGKRRRRRRIASQLVEASPSLDEEQEEVEGDEHEDSPSPSSSSSSSSPSSSSHRPPFPSLLRRLGLFIRSFIILSTFTYLVTNELSHRYFHGHSVSSYFLRRLGQRFER
jgi:hypothetical protein